MNWAAEPLRSWDIMLNFIRQTRTEKGLTVEAILNEKQYEKGTKISDDQLDSINFKEHATLPKWNYTIYSSWKLHLIFEQALRYAGVLDEQGS